MVARDTGDDFRDVTSTPLRRVTRIRVERPRHRHHVDAARDDVLGHAWSRESLSDTNKGSAPDDTFDCQRKGYKAAISRLRALHDHVVALIEATGYVNEVDSGFRKHPGELRGLFDD